MTDSPAWGNNPIMVLTPDRKGEFKAIPLSQWIPSESGGGTRSYLKSVAGIYRAVAWVYRCVQLRSDAIAGLPYELKPKARTSGRRMAYEQTLLDARLPGLLKRTEQSLCKYGAGYWFREQNKVKLLDLKWMAANTITPMYDMTTNGDGSLTHFERVVNGRKIDLSIDEKARDVVYFFLPDDDVEQGPGTAPGQVALEAAGIVGNANGFTVGFFERGGVNVTIIIADPATSDGDLKRLETWWKRFTRGVRKAWETVAMRRNVDVKTLGYEPEKLAMPELKSMARTEIASAFGVPETMIADAANFATATAHRLSFYEDTILPEAKVIAAALNEQLFAELGLELVWQPEKLQVFQEANAMEVDGIVKLFTAGIISDKAARERAGFTEKDKPKEGDRGQGTGDSQTPDEGDATPPPNDGGDEPLPDGDNDPTRSVDMDAVMEEVRRILAPLSPQKMGEEVVGDAIRAVIRDAWDRSATNNPLMVTGDGAHIAQGVVDEVVRQTALAEDAAWVDFASAVKAEGDEDDGADAARAEIEDDAETRLVTALAAQQHAVISGDVTDVEAAVGLIDDADETLRAALVWTLERGAELGVSIGVEQLASLGIEMTGASVNEAALAWAKEYAGAAVTGINDTTRAALREKLAAWIQSGDALDALVKELEPQFGRTRARLIASTEVTRSFAEGNLKAWRESDIITRKEWRTAADERVCPVCRPLSETKAKLDAAFDGGYDAPPAHPGCRCWLAPIAD